MTETPETVGAQPKSILAYGRRRRPRRWIAALVIALVAAEVAWHRQWVYGVVQDRYDVWHMYRLQAACEKASAVDGEVVARTDGRTDGVTDPSLQNWYSSSFALGRGVSRRPTRLTDFEKKVPYAASQGRFDNEGALVDCRRRQTVDGQTLLSWVFVVPYVGGFEIVTATTAPGTPWRRPGPGRTPLLNGFRDQFRWRFDSRNECGPTVIRRTASTRPDDVGLRIDFAGGTTESVLSWNDTHYDLDATKLSAATCVPRPNWERTFDLKPVVRSLPIVDPDRRYTLPVQLKEPRAIAADDKGAVVYSVFQDGTDSCGQVHFFDPASGRTSMLVEAEEALYDATLSADGRRITSHRTRSFAHDPEPLQLVIYDLRSGTRHVIDTKLIHDEDWRFVDLFDDGTNLMVCQLERYYDGKPLLDHNLVARFGSNGDLAQQYHDVPADCARPNGRYYARIGHVKMAAMGVDRTPSKTEFESLSGVSDAYVSSNGRYLCCGFPAQCVIDSTSGALVATFADQGGRLKNAAFSPDSRWLAVGQEGKAFLLDLQTAGVEQVRAVRVSDASSPCFVAFSPDGRNLMIMQRNQLQIIAMDRMASGK